MTNLEKEFAELTNEWIEDVALQSEPHIKNDQKIIPIIAGTVLGMTDQIFDQTKLALKDGIKPEVIVEVVYQLAPIAGILKVQKTIKEIKKVFDEQKISPRRIQIDENSEYGAEIQAELYGTEIKNLLKNLPDQAGTFIPRALTEHFFNDFYRRKILSVKDRERYELLALITLNVDFQIKAHARGSLKAGNSESEIIWSVIQLLPYIGFPLVINSVQIIHQTAFESKED